MVKLCKANKGRVSAHCVLLFDLWIKVRVSTHWSHKKH